MAGINTSTGKVSYDNNSILPNQGNTGSSVGSSGTTVTKDTTNEVITQGNKDLENQAYEFIEGVAQVIPNANFRCKKIYAIQGVGKVFDGNYYVGKVIHAISDTYTVNLELTQVQKIVFTDNVENRVPPAPVPPPVAQEAPQYQVIKIKWGDTLWALSRKYGTTVDKLAKMNNIKNPNLIYAGASLKVPK